jgi:hypothetical protein
VTAEVEKYVALLQARLLLLRALAQQFVDCRKEFVSMDLDGMHRRIAEQEELCRQIQSLDPAIDVLQQTCVNQFGLGRKQIAGPREAAASAERLRGVMRELREAQSEVGRLNQIYAAYLRRSSRTIQVLINFVGNYSLTYGRPAETRRLAPQFMEKG